MGRPIIRATGRKSNLLGQESVLASLRDVMFGDEVLQLRSYLDISHPMENGIIQNWDDMELLWQHTFDDCLGVKPDEHKILLTEPPLNPKKNREKMLEIMFEKFAFQGAHVGVQAVLTLYAQGTLRFAREHLAYLLF